MRLFLICLHIFIIGFVASRPSDSNDDKLENIWAVLIAGSNGWYNYRHQSDISHAYHILLKHGVLPEKIIVLMYDDIAHNPQNPFMGKIYNKPHGNDVYEGVKIDYRGENVNSEVFLNVLKGNAEGNRKKGTGRVLKSKPNENVFIYYSDHGGTDILGMPEGLLSRKDLNEALYHMYENNMYKKLLFYLEACESGSMFEGLSPKMNIYAITASRHNESSWATFCDNDMKLPCLGDEFSVNWMHNTEFNDILFETVGGQVDDVVTTTKKSHVCQFGNTIVRNDMVSEYQGKEAKTVPPKNIQLESVFFDEVQSSAIDSRQVPLVMAERTLRRLGASPEMITAKMTKYIEKRAEMTEFIHQTAQAVAPQSNLIKHVMTKIPKRITQIDCHDEAIKAFDQICAPFDRNPFAFKLSAAIANLCEIIRDSEPIISYFNKECSDGPIFYDVL
jgi:legumain